MGEREKERMGNKKGPSLCVSRSCYESCSHRDSLSSASHLTPAAAAARAPRLAPFEQLGRGGIDTWGSTSLTLYRGAKNRAPAPALPCAGTPLLSSLVRRRKPVWRGLCSFFPAYPRNQSPAFLILSFPLRREIAGYGFLPLLSPFNVFPRRWVLDSG